MHTPLSETEREQQLKRALTPVELPPRVVIRAWHESDFPEVQRLFAAEGWSTVIDRPDAALESWRNSWPALTAIRDGEIVGLVRALSDGAVTTYVAEILVVPEWRSRGLGRALLRVTQSIYPGSRLDLLASERSQAFYERRRFRSFPGYRRSWEELAREERI